MKTVAADKSFIDYTKGAFGIRVWKDRCQSIASNDGSEWQTRELAKPLPLDDAFKTLPVGVAMQPVPALTFEIAAIGNQELKDLISGSLSFDDALESENSK